MSKALTPNPLLALTPNPLSRCAGEGAFFNGRGIEGDEGRGDEAIQGAESGEEIASGATKEGMEEVGGDLGEGNEDEGALVEAGVREDQGRGVEDEVVVEKKIEVEGAGSVGEGADAAERGFDGEQGGEEGWGIEAGFETGDGVEEGGLALVADGGGFIG